MSKKHRVRDWAPLPPALPQDAHVIDNHTHVASVVPFSQALSHEAVEKGQPEIAVYSVDQLLDQAAAVGVEGVIDCGCDRSAPACQGISETGGGDRRNRHGLVPHRRERQGDSA